MQSMDCVIAAALEAERSLRNIEVENSAAAQRTLSDSDVIAQLTNARDAARAEATAAKNEAAELRSELEIFGVAAVTSASESDARIVALQCELRSERARAEAAEAEAARYQQEAAALAEAAEENEDEMAPLESEMRRRTIPDARSRRSSATSVKSVKTPASVSKSQCETPSALTPQWLREADGFAQSEAVESAEAAEAARLEREALAERAAEAEREAERRAAALEAKTAEELKAKEMELTAARGEQQEAASSVVELRALVDALEADKARLTAEKGELLAEVAQNAGHLNHKQKIHYLSKLKTENDELKLQLKEARGLAAPKGGGKENQLTSRRPRVAA